MKELAHMPILVLAAQLCPPGIEARDQEWPDIPGPNVNVEKTIKKTSVFYQKNYDWSCFVQIHIGIQMCFEWRCSPDSVATLVVLTVAVKARCSFEVFSYVRGIFDDPYSTNVPSWDVHVHFDCAGDVCSHKLGVTETSHATLSSLWVRSLSLWCGANFDSQGDLVQRSWQGGLL